MVLCSGWLSISYSSSYYFRTCPTEEWLLISLSDRHTAKKFSCAKHLIALRWSHTCSGKLETGFFANKISINAKTAAQNSLRKITHLPVHGVKQLGSFESTWQIEDFSCKVKDSRRSGMYQSWLFLRRLDMQSLKVFGFILFDEVRAELGLVQTLYFSCAEPNWISSTLERHWRDIWFRRRTVCRI